MAPTTQNGSRAVEATTQLLRAGWHPIQIQSLTILTEREASPKDIAIELGMTKAKAGYVSHHVKVLVERGLAEPTRTEPRRGANEHYYRAVMPLIVSDEDAERMSVEERLTMSCWAINCISHDFVRAIESGSLEERIDRHLSRFPMRLDEEGYQELFELHEEAFERTQRIKAQAEQRLDEAGEDGMQVSAVVASFPMPNGLPPLDQ